jgi:hypothetical protein
MHKYAAWPAGRRTVTAAANQPTTRRALDNRACRRSVRFRDVGPVAGSDGRFSGSALRCRATVRRTDRVISAMMTAWLLKMMKLRGRRRAAWLGSYVRDKPESGTRHAQSLGQVFSRDLAQGAWSVGWHPLKVAASPAVTCSVSSAWPGSFSRDPVCGEPLLRRAEMTGYGSRSSAISSIRPALAGIVVPAGLAAHQHWPLGRNERAQLPAQEKPRCAPSAPGPRAAAKYECCTAA